MIETGYYKRPVTRRELRPSQNTEPAYMLVKEGQTDVTYVLPSSKRFMVKKDLDKVKQALAKSAEPFGKPVTTKKGTSEVWGLTCQNWELSFPGKGGAIICVLEATVPWQPDTPPLAASLIDGSHIALRTMLLGPNGEELLGIEKEFERKHVDDALMTVPTDYQQVDEATGLKAILGM